MFCASCGTQVPASASKCPNCGSPAATNPAASALASAADSGVFKGILILVTSYFTMPIKTLRLTGRQLRELGAVGSFDVGQTTVPHLSWLRIAGNFLISVAIVLILVFGLYQGLASLENFRYSASAALGGLIGKPVVAVLAAVTVDWLAGTFFELLGLWAGISNDIRSMADKSR